MQCVPNTMLTIMKNRGQGNEQIASVHGLFNNLVVRVLILVVMSVLYVMMERTSKAKYEKWVGVRSLAAVHSDYVHAAATN